MRSDVEGCVYIQNSMKRFGSGSSRSLLAQHLEGVDRDFARVRHDAAGYFETVDVGLMFLILL